MERIMYSRREAAAALGISLRTLDTLIGRHELAARRIGRRLLITRVALECFVRRDHETRKARTGAGDEHR